MIKKLLKLNNPKIGFTLIELMVYMVLMGIIMSLIYNVLVGATRYLQQGDVQAELQGDAINGMSRLAHDLSESSITQLVYNVDTDKGIAFVSPRSTSGQFLLDTATGQNKWQKFICYYLDSTNKRLVKVEAPAGPLTTVPTNPNSTIALWKSAGLTQLVVCRNIYDLDFHVTGQSITIYGSYEKDCLGKDNSIKMETQVWLRP